MQETVILTFPNNIKKEYLKGSKLQDIAKEFQQDYKSDIVGAIVNNELKELWVRIQHDCSLKFIDRTTVYGNRFYSRSLAFLFIIAAKEVFEGCRVTVEHSLCKGFYCEVHKDKPLTEEDIAKIENKMRELQKMDIPFEKRKIASEEAIELFTRTQQPDKVNLIKYRKKKYINIYSCHGYHDYFYGYMVPSTGYLKVFELKSNEPGLILRFPDRSNPNELPECKEQRKLFAIFREFEKWGKILELENISHLNDAIKGGRINEVIQVAEGLHEKKIAQIADMITDSGNKRLVLISGPSSSGKTTFAERLSVQLRVNGLKPVPISIDNFFKNRADTPIGKDGEYDFETIDAIDIATFNDVIKRLINGEEVEMPIFNFHTGNREWKGKKMKIDKEQVLVVEGIHGLNEILTRFIPREQKFKIYISALTHLSIDDHNRIPTSDLRLIRRIVRDYQFRSADALSTIKRWDSVRRGEDKYIYPFQEEADIMFNSSLVYELAMLNQVALPLLEKIDNKVPEYIEAKRIKKFLQYLLEADINAIPSNSILREFVGKSCFLEKN
ncbi:MAG TPA: nucleoside kinase [Bacillota bacterium]|nr:nucleoside kinase [Bacillota bacterium]HOR86031.1 nucleoside kinase [Bacillota bacterium]HPL53109.1 nucleoside kinase [Bacillota bacterium]